MKNKIKFIIFIALIYSCRTTAIEEPIIEPSEPVVQDVETVEKVLTTEEIIANQIEDMSLEEKVGQLFIFHIRKDANGRGITNINDETRDLIQDLKPGGIILFSENVDNNEQVVSLVRDLQSYSDIPLFIGVDEEGGLVSRLGKEKNVDVTHLPPALSIGSRGDSILAYNSGKILGRELAALGINMDMAPIADVNTNPMNPVIGNRTYSADPQVAGEMVSQFIKGIQEYNVASIIKHFPGHGDTSLDTHNGSVVSPHGRERLDQIEFVPFIKGIEAGTDAIMSAHIIMPAISANPLPSTLNPDIMNGIIREEFNYQGIIITDALDMGAISQNFTSQEAVILAFKAGVDILLMPLNQKAAYLALLEAVKNGEITEKRVNESVYRILKTKYKRKIMDKNTRIETIIQVKNDVEHKKLIETIFP